MATTEKKSSLNENFELGKRGEKSFEDINVIVDFCTMPNEMKEKAINKIKEQLVQTVENNTNFYKSIAKKIKLGLEANTEDVWNVIVGSDFGAWISFEKNYVLYCRVQEKYFLIFRFGGEDYDQH